MEDGMLEKATVRFLNDLDYPRGPKNLRNGTAKDSRSRRKIARALTRFGFTQSYNGNPDLFRKQCYLDDCYVYVDISLEWWRGMEKLPGVYLTLSKQLEHLLGKRRTIFVQQMLRKFAEYDVPLVYVHGMGEIVIKSWERLDLTPQESN